MSALVPTPTHRALLVDNYDSYTYNLYHLLAAANGGACPAGGAFFAC